ncbi:MAG TPA: DUF58 domain-containing protein [Chitinophagales bacterium]|nr:DUF58 domain-containing protein [Chitinophagales bacterium]HNC63528.1 DUF58 domain-containing protein [Chitinophagales bacterium]
MEILQEDILKFDHLDVLAKQVVEGFIIGLHKSPYHGFSVEFAEHRLYNPGDSIKEIDWKVFARTDKLYTKKYEEETNLRCQIVIDNSSSMYFPKDKKDGAINKMEFSVIASAALMYLLKKQRDAVGLSIFNDDLKLHRLPKTNAQHHQMLLSDLYHLIHQEAKQQLTSAAKSLHLIADAIHKRSLVFIFSDMMDSTNEDELFLALQHLKHNKHEVVLFHTLDKKHEVDFNFENRPYQFIDMETGESIKLQPNQLKDTYLQQMQEKIIRLKSKCIQYKIDLIEVDIAEGYYPILMQYLVKRKKMKI